MIAPHRHPPARRLLSGCIAAAALASALSWLPAHSPATWLFLASVVAIATCAPGAALAFAAAAVPLLGTVAGALNSSFDWTSTGIVALIAGYFAREAADYGSDERWPPPLMLFAVVVAASLAVALATLPATFGGVGELGSAIRRFVLADHLRPADRFPPLDAAALLLEGVALAWIAMTARLEDRVRATRLIAVAGAAAAALNVNRAFEVALRRGGAASAFWDVITRVRINIHFPDVNAAGSYFAIPLFIALDRARRPGRARLAWAGAAGLIGAGVWLTGSRAAIFSAAAAIGLWIVRTALARTAPRAHRIAAAVMLAAALVAAAGIAKALPGKFGGTPAVEAVGIRVGMAKAALGMFATHPVFGIGVGAFYDRSAEFEPPALRAIYPHENAHDNFLQILAELGLAGLAAFLWILWWSVRPSPAGARAFWRSGECGGLAVGLCVFLVTCLAGHPLLIPQVAWVFWIGIGLAAAGWLPDTRRPAASTPGRPPLMLALSIVVLATVPFRAVAAHRATDRSDVAFGVSDWFRDGGGEWARTIEGRAVAFIPGTATSVQIPLRLAADVPSPVHVMLKIEDRPGDVIVLRTRDWNRVRLLVPPGRSWMKLTLVVGNPDAGSATVLLGRLQYE